MEPHPVPQNVIDVEFKLFGSFTLKQFLKILFGSLIGLFIFALGFIPAIIRLPLSAISVLLGIGMAIIPNLGTWLLGFVKALFISPRYVWTKETNTPELLQNTQKYDKTSNQTVSVSQKKIDIEDIPLDKIFANSSKEEPDDGVVDFYDPLENTQDKNYVDKLYANEFKGATADIRQPTVDGKRSTVAAETTNHLPQITNQMGLDEELRRLKFQLSALSKSDPEFDQKQQLIMNRINELYSEQKAKNLQLPQRPIAANIQQGKIKIEENKNDGKNILGIVVDKTDKVLSNVIIIFKNSEDGKIYESKTSPEGKFVTSTKLPNGTYDVELRDVTHKFHTYRIVVGVNTPVAYRFRER